VSDENLLDTNRRLAERVARFRSEIESALHELAAPLETTPGSEPGIPARVTGAIHAILDAAASGQRDILRAVLDGSTLCFARAFILIGKDSRLIEWEGRGLAGNGQDAGHRLSLPATGEHLPARARTMASLVVAGPEGPGPDVIQALGDAAPAASSAACPLMVRGRPVAILYGDSREPVVPATAELFGALARLGGAALELQAHARRPRPVAERAAGSRFPARAISGMARADDGADLPAEPEEAEMQALLGDLDPLPRREATDTELSPEEQRQHNDARRFASLLVSELLLYNEEAVIQGRKQRDLSRRLAHEIERTRLAYEARIPSALRSGPRYLDEELLRVLADGDEALMVR
jgi:hypothetical protein